MDEKEQRDKEYLKKRTVRRADGTVRRTVLDRRQSLILHHELLKFDGQDKRSGVDRRSGKDRRALVK